MADARNGKNLKVQKIMIPLKMLAFFPSQQYPPSVVLYMCEWQRMVMLMFLMTEEPASQPNEPYYILMNLALNGE